MRTGTVVLIFITQYRLNFATVIWDSHFGDYKEYHLLGCYTIVWEFQRNIKFISDYSVTFQKIKILYMKFPWRPCTVFPQLEVVYCNIEQKFGAAQKWHSILTTGHNNSNFFCYCVGSNSYHMDNTVVNILSISIYSEM